MNTPTDEMKKRSLMMDIRLDQYIHWLIKL